MKLNMKEMFNCEKPVIACIHLLPLPGSPLYDGDLDRVYTTALREATIFKKYHVDGLIIENFHDKPFYPHRVPCETIAAITAIARDIIHMAQIPVGINVLRNDATAALSIATAVQADFIRVNVHTNVVVSEQGIIEGMSYETLRLRANLKSKVLIFADVAVKHAAPLASRGLAIETLDATYRGLADGIIVSGELTGREISHENLDIVKQHAQVPILIGSGATPENIHKVYHQVNGFIVGSYFKEGGYSDNLVDETRVERFMQTLRGLQ